MAIVGVLTTVLAGNPAPLLASLASSQTAMKGFAASNAGVAGSFAPIGAAAGVAALAIVAGAGMAVRAAASFESQLNTINTIARLTPDALHAVGKEIRGLAVESGTALPDLTASFYDLLSVGVPLADAMGVLGSSVNLSLGGLGTVNEAATAITGSINAWSIAQGAANLTLADTARVTDILAKGIELGDIKTRDLPAALANIAPMAASFNTPIEEVIASLALMSTKFITPTEGATAMNAAFTALQRIPPGMEKLQKVTGKSYETIARTGGMHEAMMQIVADSALVGVNLVDVFGRVDALPYVMQTTGAAAAQFGQFMGQAMDPAGTALEQANERTKGLDHQLDLLDAAAGDLGLTMGNSLLPPITDFVGKINDVATGALAWADANPKLADSFGSLTPAVLLFGAALLLVSGPLAIIGVGLALAVANMDKLIAGAGVVQAALGPQGEAQTFRDRFQMEHGRMPSPLEFGQFQAGTLPPQWGELNTPGFHAGEVGSPYAPQPGGWRTAQRPGGPTQITLNHHSDVYLDGTKVGEVVERKLYNDASTYSSGFTTGPSPIR